jgi:hypothetical protein
MAPLEHTFASWDSPALIAQPIFVNINYVGGLMLMISQRGITPYSALSPSSTLWMLPAELLINPLLLYHSHHAEELQLPWTRRGVARAARLVQKADNFEAPALSLARWLEWAPAVHGPLLADAVLGRADATDWSRASVQPCFACGFPPTVHTHDEAISRLLLPDATLDTAHSRSPELEE